MGQKIYLGRETESRFLLHRLPETRIMDQGC